MIDFLNDPKLEYMLGVHGDFTGYCPSQPHVHDMGVVPPFSRDIPESIAFLEWFNELFGSRYDHQQFFISKDNVFTDMHYDSYHNFYICVSGVRRWTLAPPEASRWLQTNGVYSNASDIAPHLDQYGKFPMLRSFNFVTIDLRPGDLLYVPSFWWHQVESLPCKVSGYTIAFNYFFSERPNKVYKALDEAHAVCTGFYHQALGSLRGSRKKRAGTFTHPETEVVSPERRRRADVPLSYLDQPKKRVKWADKEVEFFMSCMPHRMGQWAQILTAGRGIFNECRKPRDLLEKARTLRRQGIEIEHGSHKPLNER